MVKPTNIPPRSGYVILLLPKPHSPFLVAFLQRNGYSVCDAHSPDHLVALCSSNPVKAVIVDLWQLGEIEGWSVLQSIKMVKPSLSVILLCHAAIPESVELPTAVDALTSDSDLPGLLTVLDRHTRRKTAAHNRDILMRYQSGTKRAFGTSDDLRTGRPIPETGFYRVIHSQHRLPREVTLIIGQSFPRCAKCAEPVYFELIRPAPSLGMNPSRFNVTLYELPEMEEQDDQPLAS